MLPITDEDMFAVMSQLEESKMLTENQATSVLTTTLTIHLLAFHTQQQPSNSLNEINLYNYNRTHTNGNLSFSPQYLSFVLLM